MIDVPQLILPISEDAVTGEDLRQDISPTSAYYTLKDIRNTLRANERNALIDEESILSVIRDWRPLVEQIPTVLQEQSKDLELAAWLIEALCRLDGFPGMTAGFELATTLIEQFWDTLYPMPDPDDGDLSERVSPLAGLNGYESEGALILPIKSIPLTVGGSLGPYSLWEYERAVDLQRLDEEKRARRAENGAVTLADIEQSVKETPTEFFLELEQEIQQALDSYQRLSQAMDDAIGEPQPTSYIKKTLELCQQAITHLVGDRLEMHRTSQPAPETPQADDTEGEESTAASTTVVQSQVQDIDPIEFAIQSRNQAIASLKSTAEYFRKTEPHSPMSYALEQVIRWSDMPLPDLLQELISDQDARSGYFKLSGIKVDE
ncbi:type VI secretion system protein TssA [Algicola sagamiensis]|uniref:type VI secretion system protein TssA n=1 Tax=Algicola sagamiensis TaxID=163869 RepID=UPI000377EE43|nr:type VI secretion system protein TssA [Algicola sagamiensis]